MWEGRDVKNDTGAWALVAGKMGFWGDRVLCEKCVMKNFSTLLSLLIPGSLQVSELRLTWPSQDHMVKKGMEPHPRTKCAH